MHNFKPGDLALIVGTVRTPANLGKVVTVFCMVEGRGDYIAPDGRKYYSLEENLACVVEGEGLKDPNGAEGWTQVAPQHLMPLRGEPDQLPAKKEESTV